MCSGVLSEDATVTCIKGKCPLRHWNFKKYCKSVEGINDIVMGWLIVAMITTYSEDSRHSMQHALTKVLIISGPRATQACCRATRNYVVIVGGLSMSQIWTAIWSKGCSVRFIWGRLHGQLMTSTSWFTRKSLVAWAGRGRVLSLTRTKLLWKVALAQYKRLCCSTRLYTCWSIPWICYERSFNEFYLSIWNQLVVNQRLQLFVQPPQPCLLIFAWRN